MYQQRIAEALGNSDPATCALVEDLMRDGRSGLDSLSRTQFTRAAREAMSQALSLALLHELGDYCEAVGLATPTLRV